MGVSFQIRAIHTGPRDVAVPNAMTAGGGLLTTTTGNALDAQSLGL